MFSPDRHLGAFRRNTPPRVRQKGASLIELLVGLTIGLLVIAAALGTLLISRGSSVAITEMSQLQQQGSYALRVIGVQFRQAGSVELMQAASGAYAFSSAFTGFGGGPTVVTGKEGANGLPDEVSVSNQPSAVLATQRRDCLGRETTGDRMDSTFFVRNAQLYCRGSDPKAQAIIGNVADFQVSYRVKTDAGTQSLAADKVKAANLWSSVSAIEICLDLQGTDNSNPQAGTYQTCRVDGSGTPVRASRDGRIHLVYRNVFNLRTQGFL
ncbi:type IV pilus assembly protein PilW [Variovorax sp. HW608]|uniref:PilW family protein n=1 Tax=Variovorax sp. HW608 TaxID=1034889 RepID=UPI00081F7B1A|nr:prepilin-type N-terminal cleavage/methylation domain-containing protein [Variovorax sp. HW608]SCK52526.1 type IV pilus assembly protein PilW [Variovorax sp. HW608]